MAKWLRQRSAKPLFPGSNPGAASREIKGLGLQPNPFSLRRGSKVLYRYSEGALWKMEHPSTPTCQSLCTPDLQLSGFSEDFWGQQGRYS